MTLADELRRRAHAARLRARRAMQSARPSQINVARRTNVEAVVNVGGDGEAHSASATQVAPVHQDRAGS